MGFNFAWRKGNILIFKSCVFRCYLDLPGGFAAGARNLKFGNLVISAFNQEYFFDIREFKLFLTCLSEKFLFWRGTHKHLEKGIINRRTLERNVR